ncbi:MAG: flagellar M-ring protein FliF [Solirubrobacteraceae bacterium]|nr:flagellar M-ring protein FliF [Solirubrobacteraceae bacterium]
MPLPKVLANLSPKGRIAVGGAIAGVLLVAFIMFSLASRPSYTTIVTGLDPAQTGKMSAALDEKGVGYELQNNGTALAVEKADVAAARIALAEVGGLSGGSIEPGFELFDSQSMGTSQMQQQVTYQRAMEGELARTINKVQGVSGATVQLVLPDADDVLLSEDAPPASAAVLLGGADLEPSAVKGIASLVASSVKSLKPSNVTITDGAGQLLWPNGSSGEDGAGGAVLAKQAASQRYQRSMESSLTSLLAQTVGPDKARVRVSADIDADKATREQLRYGRRRVALKEKTTDEEMEGTAATGGTTGTAANVPGYAATGGANGGGDSTYRNETGDREFGADKTVTKTEIAAGGVTRQSVAVMVSDAVPAAQVPAIRDAVAAAAGVDTDRGDRLTVTRVPFAEAPAAAPPAAMIPGNVVDYVKWVALALGTIVFLVLIGRHLRRREDEALESAVWFDEIEAPRTLRALEAEQRTQAMAAVAPPAEVPQLEVAGSRRRIEELADNEPERVAQQVRHWMSEE